MQFLPAKIHGALDYLVATVLMVVPFVLEFHLDSELAHWLSFSAGISLFLYSMSTDYELGVRNAISIRHHLILDGAAGAVFIVLAFVAGFETVTAVFYGVVGAAVLAVVAVTKVESPETERQPVTV